MSSPTPSAEPAFDISECDIILTSSDQIQFGVHKAILSNASPVFEGMFSLPTDGSSDEPPAIQVTEPGPLLEQLLRFCYPSLNGTVLDIEMLRLLFAAAEKYEMKGVTSQLAYILRWQFILKEPYRAYALACTYGFWDEAQLAGKQTLAHPFPEPALSEYNTLPASMHHKLVTYRLECTSVIDRVLDDWKYTVCGMITTPSWTGPECIQCPKSYGTSVAYWFVDHLAKTKAAFVAIPRGSSVVSTELVRGTVDIYLSADRRCPCRAIAPMRLIEFNERLAAILDQRIAQIPFVLK